MEDQGEILARLDERSKGIKEDVANVLVQLTKLNSKVATHEDEIHKIKLNIAVAQGHWKGIVLMGTIFGFVVGIIAVYLWH